MQYFPSTNLGRKVWLLQALVAGPLFFVAFLITLLLAGPNVGLGVLAIGAFWMTPALALVPFPFSLAYIAAEGLQAVYAYDSTWLFACINISFYLASGPYLGRLVEVANAADQKRSVRLLALLALLGGIPTTYWALDWLTQWFWY